MAHLIIVDLVPASVSFEDFSHVIDTGNTHTHSGLTFGPASSDRLLIVTLTTNANNIANLNSVTIGGVAATRRVRHFYNQSFPTTTTSSSEIWTASVPTGTSGSVVLNLNTSGNLWNSSVAVYSATNLLSTTPTATTGADDVSHPGTLNMSIAMQAGGFVVAAAYFCGTGVITNSSWSGATRRFLDVMQNNIGGLGAQSGATMFGLSNATVSTTTTFSGGGVQAITGTMVAFR